MRGGKCTATCIQKTTPTKICMYMKNLFITYSEGLIPPRLTSTSPSETMDSVTFSSSSPIKQTPSLH